MWLINTTTLRLEFINDANDVSYAILSHTWESDEVTFEDMANLSLATKRTGWHKIQKTCTIARTQGYNFAWVDTCCIDKSSSAELSEAINAMFSWYRKSAICYAYLADLHSPPESFAKGEALHSNTIKENLERCRWFTRGWTLQELIAPVNVRFYNSSWGFLASKNQIRTEISQITGIDVSVLENMENLADIPIGRKMAWASQRQTTRIEDIAYCLLGIFGIAMPTLYGESHKAFMRLQEEIARNSNDLTLFAWEQEEDKNYHYRGIFAHSPREFRNCAYLRTQPARFNAENEFGLTNRGLRIARNLTYWPQSHSNRHTSEDEYLLLGLDCLECSQRTEYEPRWIAITLERFGSTYLRSSPERLKYFPSRASWLHSSEQNPEKVVAYIARSLSSNDMVNLQSKAIVSLTFKPALRPDREKYYTKGLKGADYIEIFEVIAPRNFLTYMPFLEKLWQATEVASPAIAFGFQGPSNELWAMPYLEDELRKDTQSGKPYNRDLATIRDFLFEKFSDPSGRLATHNMPTSIEVRDPTHNSWMHHFSVRISTGTNAPRSTHILQSTESIGSFSVEFIHTIKDENRVEELRGNI